MLEKEVNPCFISSYVPRQCGIATFTNNLFISYQSLYPCAGKVIAVDDNSGRDYPNILTIQMCKQLTCSMNSACLAGLRDDISANCWKG